jgi:hypothetical protein
MENTPVIGRIYHVIDKTTGQVIKVGSTSQTLKRRFNGWDYKKKYTNHFLLEVRQIESSDVDWFERGNQLCPFMWHLVAAEHVEIFRAGTFQKGKLSNQISPLVQKSRGLGGDFGHIGGRIGGVISGNNAVKNKTGIHAPGFDKSLGGRTDSPAKLIARRANLRASRTKEHQIKAGIAAGIKNVESGWISELGKIWGRKNVESGRLARIAKLGASIGASTRNHNQYHVKRGIVSPTCKLCK